MIYDLQDANRSPNALFGTDDMSVDRFLHENIDYRRLAGARVCSASLLNLMPKRFAPGEHFPRESLFLNERGSRKDAHGTNDLDIYVCQEASDQKRGKRKLGERVTFSRCFVRPKSFRTRRRCGYPSKANNFLIYGPWPKIEHSKVFFSPPYFRTVIKIQPEGQIKCS